MLPRQRCVLVGRLLFDLQQQHSVLDELYGPELGGFVLPEDRMR